MSSYQSRRRFRFDDGDGVCETLPSDGDDDDDGQRDASAVAVAAAADHGGDYAGVPCRPYLTKILHKQGDKKVLFADRLLKFTSSGKMKRRILLITDFAIYVVDPETEALKRRIALAAVDKICLSELSDNFFAIVIPTEYDMLMASTRKNEIVTVLVEAIKSTSDYELEVVSSNRFEYHAAADQVKEAQFEEVDGGVKTKIVRK